MSRVALISDNSVEFIDLLVEIWNNDDCVVIIDWRTPIDIACKMMIEASVTCCYIDKALIVGTCLEGNEWIASKIELKTFNSTMKAARLLSDDVYNKFHANYSAGEAIIIYSSGTTGRSKGIILSHYAINCNADAIQDYMKLTHDDCLYIAKSLSHSSTLVGEMLVALKNRIPLVVAPTLVPPRYVLNNINLFSVSTIALNPTLISMYAEEVQRKKYDFPSLKTIYVSGSVLDDRVYETVHSVFHQICIYNIYGLSEAGPRVSAQRIDCCKGNSVGKAIKGVEIAVVNEDGDLVARGKRGIIHVQTRSLYLGYVSGKEKFPSLFKGWLNTGDIGFVDDNNELHVIDRVDDVIIIDSHKIYPSDIENVIRRETQVDDCIVYKKESGGGVFLSCSYSASVEIHDIKKKIARFLLSYEIPKEFVYVADIPHNINGKKLRQS